MYSHKLNTHQMTRLNCKKKKKRKEEAIFDLISWKCKAYGGHSKTRIYCHAKRHPLNLHGYSTLKHGMLKISKLKIKIQGKNKSTSYLLVICDPWQTIVHYITTRLFWLQCTVPFRSNTELVINWIINKLKSQTVCLFAEVIFVHFAESSALELGCITKGQLFPARPEPFYITITDWLTEKARTEDILWHMLRSSLSLSISEDHLKWFVVLFSRKEHKCRSFITHKMVFLR